MKNTFFRKIFSNSKPMTAALSVEVPPKQLKCHIRERERAVTKLFLTTQSFWHSLWEKNRLAEKGLKKKDFSTLKRCDCNPSQLLMKTGHFIMVESRQCFDLAINFATNFGHLNLHRSMCHFINILRAWCQRTEVISFLNLTFAFSAFLDLIRRRVSIQSVASVQCCCSCCHSAPTTLMMLYKRLQVTGWSV